MMMMMMMVELFFGFDTSLCLLTKEISDQEIVHVEAMRWEP